MSTDHLLLQVELPYLCHLVPGGSRRNYFHLMPKESHELLLEGSFAFHLKSQPHSL